MFVHPSIHIELARQRQQDLVTGSERHATANAAFVGGNEDRRQLLIRRSLLCDPSETTAGDRPRGVIA